MAHATNPFRLGTVNVSITGDVTLARHYDPIRDAKSASRRRSGMVKVSDAYPAITQQVSAFCLDNRGIYELPFPCTFDGARWINVKTNEAIDVDVFGWIAI